MQVWILPQGAPVQSAVTAPLLLINKQTVHRLQLLYRQPSLRTTPSLAAATGACCQLWLHVSQLRLWKLAAQAYLPYQRCQHADDGASCCHHMMSSLARRVICVLLLGVAPHAPAVHSAYRRGWGALAETPALPPGRALAATSSCLPWHSATHAQQQAAMPVNWFQRVRAYARLSTASSANASEQCKPILRPQPNLIFCICPIVMMQPAARASQRLLSATTNSTLAKPWTRNKSQPVYCCRSCLLGLQT